WRDRSDLRRRLDQSELLRQSMLPPSDEGRSLERTLFQELDLSEGTDSLEVVHFPHVKWGQVQVLRSGPGSPERRWTSESQSVAELEELLNDRSRTVDDRCAAVVALAARQRTEAVPLLTAALDFGEPDIQRQAAFALARLGAKVPRAIEVLQ